MVCLAVRFKISLVAAACDNSLFIDGYDAQIAAQIVGVLHPYAPFAAIGLQTHGLHVAAQRQECTFNAIILCNQLGTFRQSTLCHGTEADFRACGHGNGVNVYIHLIKTGDGFQLPDFICGGNGVLTVDEAPCLDDGIHGQVQGTACPVIDLLCCGEHIRNGGVNGDFLSVGVV